MNSSFYFLFPIFSTLGFLLSVYLPFVGIILYFFLFIPFILSFFFLTRREFILSFIISVFLLIILNKNVLLPYILSLIAICFPGTLLLMKKKESPWRIVLYNSLWAIFLISVILLLLYQLKDFSIAESFDQFIRNTLQEVTNTYKKIGLKEAEIQQAKMTLEKLFYYFQLSFPAWLIISLSSFIITHYYLCMKILFHLNILKTDFPEFSRWKTPFFIVWIFILSSLLLWRGKNFIFLSISGLNLLTLTVFIFILQGLCNLNFFLQKSKIPRILSAFIYLLIFIQPLFLSIIFLWGLFDSWFNFRKLPVG